MTQMNDTEIEKRRSTLVDRLRGIYRIPITDGLGPAGGEAPNNPNEFVRNFVVPPINNEAADEIIQLRARLEAGERGAADRLDAVQAAYDIL